MGCGPVDGVPYVLIFLKDFNPYLSEFRRKPWKTPKGLDRQAQPGIESGTSRLPVFERRTAHPLSGPRTDRFMPYPGFEQGTFGAASFF